MVHVLCVHPVMNVVVDVIETFSNWFEQMYIPI